MRSFCSQVFRQARLWDRIEKSVRSSEFTFPGDPMRLDYSHRRNGTRGFIQSLSVTRAPADAKGPRKNNFTFLMGPTCSSRLAKSCDR